MKCNDHDDHVVPSAILENGAVVACPLNEAVEVLHHDLPQQLRVIYVQDRLAKEEPATVSLGGVLLVQVGEVLEHVGHVRPQQVEGAGGEVTLLVGNSQLLKLVEVLGDVSVEQQRGGACCNDCSNQPV